MGKRKQRRTDETPRDHPAPRKLTYAVCVGLGLTILLLYAFFHRSPSLKVKPQIDPATEIEFDGDRMVFHMSPEKFQALPYDQRAEELSRQVTTAFQYAVLRTGAANTSEVICRLETAGTGVIRINATPDLDIQEMLSCNYLFSTHVRYSKAQEKFIRRMIAGLNEDTRYQLDDNEYLRKMSGFSDTGFFRPHLTDGALRYIRNAMTLRDISRTIVGAAGHSGRAKLEALMDWTFVNVSNHFERIVPGKEDFVDFNDRPLGYMLRGMGDCDRSAWVLCRLAEHAGLSGHVVYLHRAGQEGVASWHTIAEIRTDQVWKAVDPFNNRIYDQSIVRLSRDTDYFKYSWIFANHAPPHSLIPVMKLTEMICRFYIPDQKLFEDIEESVYLYLRDEYGKEVPPVKALEFVKYMAESKALKMASDEVSLTRWEFPFWIRGYYYQNAFRDYKYKKFPFLEKLRAARLEQLLGHYEAAEKAFNALKHERDESDPRFEEERDYFMILNHYYKQDYPAVERGVVAYRKKYPDTPRNTMLLYVLAHSLNRMGRPQHARVVYPASLPNFQGRGWIR